MNSQTKGMNLKALHVEMRKSESKIHHVLDGNHWKSRVVYVKFALNLAESCYDRMEYVRVTSNLDEDGLPLDEYPSGPNTLY